ncbi:pyruvate kinase [[Mycoplasma] testudinis]|uniref:pyruvate kinase n=1 Tax=[Mycoplasma] testudinis TaxID=33924 RepID=UPI00048002B9|nr:pyruvate kinase [[Mycoplasma] testudinis]
MFNHFKRTKIIATCGPSITQKLWSLEDLENPKNAELKKLAYENMQAIIEKGVTAIRLNFSHGNHAEQLVRIKIAREVAAKLGIPISIVLDTQGPEIRIGQVAPEGCKILQGDTVKIYTRKNIVGSGKQFYATDASGKYNMIDDLKIGSHVLVDDGKLSMEVIELNKKDNILVCKALNSHTVISHKRINLPHADYSIPFLSEKDIGDLKFGIENKVDYVAASFVNSGANIKELRKILDDNGGKGIKIISKVESTQAIKNIDDIINLSDAVMVARGDLSLEIPYYEVPHWERYIIKMCRFKNRRVVVATQMLDSLEKNIQPTRAEVTDVYFAVDRGADSTMLSGETANGLYPIVAVDVMSTINKQSEVLFDYERATKYYFPKSPVSKSYFGELVAKVAKKTCPPRLVGNKGFGYDFVVHFTNNIREIYALANARIAASVIIVTDDDKIYTGHGIDYGILTYKVDDLKAAKNEYAKVAKQAINRYKEFGKIKSDLSNLVIFNNRVNKL